MRICPKCGKENYNNSKYCDRCGKVLIGEDTARRNKRGLVLLAVVTVILIFLFIIGIVFVLRRNPTPTTEASPASTSEPEPEPEPDPEPDPEPEPEPDPEPDPDPEPHVLPSAIPDTFYVYNGHTYAFYDASRYGFYTYDEVVDFCRKQGGYLAVINDYKENNYLFSLVRDNYVNTVFFGYSDEDSEGNWKWSEGDSDYDNWTTDGDWDLPDNGIDYGEEEDYAEFNYESGKAGIPNDGTWNDAPFRSNTDVFLCEWDYDVVEALNN